MGILRGRHLISLALVLAMSSLLLVGCGGTATNQQATTATYTIKLAHNLKPTPDALYQVWATKFADLVKQYSNGKVKVDIYPAGQLGEDVNVAQQVKVGTVQAEIMALGNLSTLYRPVDALSLPFLCSNFDSGLNVLHSSAFNTISTGFEKATGLKIVGALPYGFRGLTNSKHPVLTPADLKGLKIRVPPSPIYEDTWRALGASPVTIDSNELFSSLQEHVVDGQEAVLDWAYSNRMQEVQKYLTLTNHSLSTAVFIMSDKYLNTLPPDIRQDVEKAAADSTTYATGVARTDSTTIVQKFKSAGLQVVSPDLAPFKALVQPIYKKYANSVGGMNLVNQLVQAAQQKS